MALLDDNLKKQIEIFTYVKAYIVNGDKYNCFVLFWQ